MPRKFLVSIDLNKNELQNAVLQNLATAPASPFPGQMYFDTVANAAMSWNGTAWVSGSGGTVTGVTGSGAIKSTGGNAPVISIDAVTTTTDGAMLATDKVKLNAATSALTPSTIVMRDASNNINGIASSALKLSTARAINGVNFDGTAAITITAAPTAHASTHKSGGGDAIRLDELAAPTAAVALNSQRITGMGAPSAGTDAATKDYVDAARTGISVKDPVRVATAAALPACTYAAGVLTATAAAVLTVDGVAVALNDRILVKNEALGKYNGIYFVSQLGTAGVVWKLTRATDCDAAAELKAGMAVWVNEGTDNSDSRWVLTTNDTITLDTTALVFTKDFQASDIVPGGGMTKSGNQLDVVGTANRITVNADSVDIASTYVGQTSITTLGTITAGTWNGNDIPVTAGGTGASDAGTARTNLGIGSLGTQASSAVSITGGSVTGITDIAIADGGTGASTVAGAKSNLGFKTGYSADNVAATAGAITTYTHNLGTLSVDVKIYNKTTGAQEEFDVCATTVNAVTISATGALTAGTHHIVITG